jgi:hypothetical protein
MLGSAGGKAFPFFNFNLNFFIFFLVNFFSWIIDPYVSFLCFQPNFSYTCESLVDFDGESVRV